LKTQLTAIEAEKNKYHDMLTRKSNFVPLQVDYDKLYDMREKAQLEMKQDLEVNIIQFHEEKHKRDEKKIVMLEDISTKIKGENEQLVEEIAKLKEIIGNWKKNLPQMADQGAQVFLIAEGKGSESYAHATGGLAIQFLQNVITPFSFSKDITGSLINILTIDKVLYDYDIIRQRLGLISF
jgi:hypothetical protein